MSNRLVLGTAQFGMAYGIANTGGKVLPQRVGEIISCAKLAGVTTLDTAISYGDSEAVLGEIGVCGWKVVTKLPAFPDYCSDVRGWVNSQFEGSLKRLQLSRIYGLLLHRPQQLLGSGGAELYNALCTLKAEGLVAKIGVSVYQPEELAPLFTNMTFDIVQAPFNIVDRRLLDSGWLERLRLRSVELHVRSVFLQGLMVMLPSKRPESFRRWQSLWDSWDTWLSDNRLTPIAACLRYALSVAGVSRVVVGVETVTQLREILAVADGYLPSVPDELKAEDVDLLNPQRWCQV